MVEIPRTPADFGKMPGLNPFSSSQGAPLPQPELTGDSFRQGTQNLETMPRMPFSSIMSPGAERTAGIDDEPPTPTTPWVTSQGVHNGTYYEITHPVGWTLVQLPTTAILVSPYDKNAVVSLMWMNGMGAMDPPTLINNVVQYNGIQDYQVTNSTPVQVINTPAGSFRMMEQEADYTFRGEKVHHQVTSIVNDNTDPYMLFWNGSMIWNQAPKEKWDEYRQIMGQIVASFKVVPPPPPPPPPDPAPAPTTGGSTLPPVAQ